MDSTDKFLPPTSPISTLSPAHKRRFNLTLPFPSHSQSSSQFPSNEPLQYHHIHPHPYSQNHPHSHPFPAERIITFTPFEKARAEIIEILTPPPGAPPSSSLPLPALPSVKTEQQQEKKEQDVTFHNLQSQSENQLPHSTRANNWSPPDGGGHFAQSYINSGNGGGGCYINNYQYQPVNTIVQQQQQTPADDRVVQQHQHATPSHSIGIGNGNDSDNGNSNGQPTEHSLLPYPQPPQQHHPATASTTAHQNHSEYRSHMHTNTQLHATNRTHNADNNQTSALNHNPISTLAPFVSHATDNTIDTAASTTAAAGAPGEKHDTSSPSPNLPILSLTALHPSSSSMSHSNSHSQPQSAAQRHSQVPLSLHPLPSPSPSSSSPFHSLPTLPTLPGLPISPFSPPPVSNSTNSLSAFLPHHHHQRPRRRLSKRRLHCNAHSISQPRSAPSSITCPTCSKVYTESSNLSKHIRTVHLKLRPFHCTHCPSRFAERNKLSKHIQSVHFRARPFKCDLCDSTFSQASDRKRHRAVLHEGKRPFVCELCKKAFGRRSSLVQHRMRVHKIQPHRQQEGKGKGGLIEDMFAGHSHRQSPSECEEEDGGRKLSEKVKVKEEAKWSMGVRVMSDTGTNVSTGVKGSNITDSGSEGETQDWSSRTDSVNATETAIVTGAVTGIRSSQIWSSEPVAVVTERQQWGKKTLKSDLWRPIQPHFNNGIQEGEGEGKWTSTGTVVNSSYSSLVAFERQWPLVKGTLKQVDPNMELNSNAVCNDAQLQDGSGHGRLQSHPTNEREVAAGLSFPDRPAPYTGGVVEEEQEHYGKVKYNYLSYNQSHGVS